MSTRQFYKNVYFLSTSDSVNSSIASVAITGGLSVQKNVRFSQNLTVGNVMSTGITTGNINFTGELYQNSVPYVGSQWSGTNGNLLYYGSTGSTYVGINTSTPSFNLDVSGGARITTGITTGSILSTGLTTGNINFTGALFQNNSPYVGSQWSGTNGNLLYYGSTGSTYVGINTSTPSFNLDVSGGARISTGITTGTILSTGITTSNLFVTGNTTLGNLLFTNGTIANIVTNNVNYGIANTYSGSFIASNNTITPANVTGMSFTNSNVRSFSAKMTVSIIRSAGGNLFATFTLDGTQTDAGWVLFTSYDGDITGVDFSITSLGVMQYTSTNITNFTSNLFRYSVTQITNTGTYETLLNPTVGSYVVDGFSSNDFISTNFSSSNFSVTNFSIGNLSADTINYGIANTFSGTFFATVNGSPVSVTQLIFNSTNIVSFTINMTVSTSTLFESFLLEGIQTSTGWVLLSTSQGDVTGVVFSINSSTGQVNYTSASVATLRFVVTQTSKTGTYNSLAITTIGNYIMNSLSTGTLFVGDVTVGGNLIPDTNITRDLGSSTNRWRDIYLSGNTIDLGGTLISATNGGTAIAFGSTIITTTTVGNIGSSIPNLVSNSISTGTLRSTDLFLSGTLTTVNITTQNLLVTTNSSTIGSLLVSGGNINMTGGNINMTGGNINVSGNILARNSISTGTLLANNLKTNHRIGSLGQYYNGNSVGTLSTSIDIDVINKRLQFNRKDAVNAVSRWIPNIMPAARNWSSIAWSPELGIFAQLTEGSGTTQIFTSPDGINWTIRTTPNTANLRNIIWVRELNLFIVSTNTSTLNAMTSSDGITWTTQTTPAQTSNFYTGTWSPELSLFIVSDLSGGKIMYTSDGITYNITGTTTNNIIQTAWSPELGMFAGTQYNNGSFGFSYSFDGLTWIGTAAGLAGINWWGICWSPELYCFVATSQSGNLNNVATSPDGINWTARPGIPGSAILSNVIWAQEISLFLIGVQGGGLWTSSDAITWTLRRTTIHRTYTVWSPELSIFLSVVHNSSLYYVSTPGLVTPQNTGLAHGTLEVQNKISSLGYQYTVNSTNGNPIMTDLRSVVKRIKTSRATATSAVSTWTLRTSNLTCQGIAWSPELGLFAATNFNGGTATTNAIQTSPDGIIWTTRTTPNIRVLSYIIWSSELTLFVATSYDAGTSSVITSPDAITWTSRTTPAFTGSAGWSDICYSPELGLFASVSQTTTNTSWIMTSSNGTTWTGQTTPSSSGWIGICWAAELNLFVAGSSITSTNCIATSPNGINWTLQTTPNINVYSIKWSAELGLLVGIGIGASCITSFDGITWTTRTTPNGTWNTLVWSQELSIFAACQTTVSTNAIMISHDGINWVARTTPNTQLWGLCYSPELSIFVGVNPLSTSVITSNIGAVTVRNSIISGVRLPRFDNGTFTSSTQVSIPILFSDSTYNYVEIKVSYRTSSNTTNVILGCGAGGFLVTPKETITRFDQSPTTQALGSISQNAQIDYQVTSNIQFARDTNNTGRHYFMSESSYCFNGVGAARLSGMGLLVINPLVIVTISPSAGNLTGSWSTVHSY